MSMMVPCATETEFEQLLDEDPTAEQAIAAAATYPVFDIFQRFIS